MRKLSRASANAENGIIELMIGESDQWGPVRNVFRQMIGTQGGIRPQASEALNS